MKITLGPAAQKIIEERVRTGAYSSPEEVISAALAALIRGEAAATPEKSAMELLLEDGECGGEPLDAEGVFAELHGLRTRSGRSD
jgi:putative addiction module CopG family antidote